MANSIIYHLNANPTGAIKRQKVRQRRYRGVVAMPAPRVEKPKQFRRGSVPIKYTSQNIVHTTYYKSAGMGELEGIGSKLKKLRKKLKKPVRDLQKKVHAKTLPPKIYAKTKKWEQDHRDEIKKVGQAAAMAVATVATGGAAAAGFAAFAKAAAIQTVKSLAVDAVVKTGVKRIAERKEKKESKKLNAEIQQMQKELEQVQTKGAQIIVDQNLPPAVQQQIRDNVAAKGPEWLKTPEALELMRPAIVKQAEVIAQTVSTNPMAPVATVTGVDQQITDTQAIRLNSPIVLGAAGAVLLLVLLARS